MRKKVFKFWKRYSDTFIFFSIVAMIIVSFIFLLIVLKDRNRKVTAHEYNRAISEAYLVGWDGGSRGMYSTGIITVTLQIFGSEEKFFEEVNADEDIVPENKKVIIETFKKLKKDYYTTRKK
jgi:hypothetical protein